MEPQIHFKLLELSAGLPVFAKKDLIIIQVGIGGGVEGWLGEEERVIQLVTDNRSRRINPSCCCSEASLSRLAHICFCLNIVV